MAAGGWAGELVRMVASGRRAWAGFDDGCSLVESESGCLLVFGYGGVRPADCMCVLPAGWVRV